MQEDESWWDVGILIDFWNGNPNKWNKWLLTVGDSFVNNDFDAVCIDCFGILFVYFYRLFYFM